MIQVARMSRMRDLEKLFRISARSIPEVIGIMERALANYGESRRVKFRGRKLSNEAFINAAVIYLLDLPPDQQEAALVSGLGRLEGMLAADPVSLQDDPVVRGTVVDEDTSGRKGRKRA